jgi:predicted membrane chloride channel (bestrophin family)
MQQRETRNQTDQRFAFTVAVAVALALAVALRQADDREELKKGATVHR